MKEKRWGRERDTWNEHIERERKEGGRERGRERKRERGRGRK